ncbi:SDR family NAD(P)-dependent oxidoreductase [Lichenicoccus roseus]|uniref:SDR family NAD(P)-dependent oxidoreductase n=1 Tax=Lichenicoccus roseus TaxID=2683649 RepID=A0A5R9J7W7_9PROT|nr:SDR family NAD(P)-dependent oxidoreductase [Lichenicoccus roseus]TLU73714.1 SDR family NAD(P)-dependent oxidoreductase [Lichenicoccus roseus]
MPDPSSPGTILLVGASRGLGLAMAERYLQRGWTVVGTVRGERTKLHGLLGVHAGRLEIHTADVTEPDQIEALRGRLGQRRFDILFVNAGIINEEPDAAAGTVPDAEFVRVMLTNALGPMRAVEALQDLVPADGMIGVMSSGQGSVANNTVGRREVYRGSKAALNSFMRSFAARHAGDPRTMVLMAPGWVRTDLGGPDAPLAIEDSVPKLIEVLAGLRGGPGLRYVDYLGRTVPW